ncbi:hypothetical protein ACH492_28730 [Streptomyces sp. NPDC019443]|uniref:hypothetical protein n=1 Tax=Streptomyces sp. NPDC019443 TaxID=3365061 RepID=UPI00379DA77B
MASRSARADADTFAVPGHWHPDDPDRGVVRGAGPGPCLLEGAIPVARVHALEQQLPGLTRGEGVLECAFDHYQQVRGTTPARPRTDNDPLNREEYLLRVVRRVAGRGAGA